MSSGGGSGNGGGSVENPVAIVAGVAAVVYGVTGALNLGQRVYEATYHVHLGDVGGDWGSLFLN